VLNYAVEIMNEYEKAFDTKDPESDYWRDKLDERQKRIFKGKFQPFEVRYPKMKEVKTTKGR
jgi:hypothetical protein